MAPVKHLSGIARPVLVADAGAAVNTLASSTVPSHNAVRYSVDTLFNLVSGLGTNKDKSFYNQFSFSMMNVQQLEAGYRSDWVARKITDIPAQDSTRMWRSWEGAEEQQISDLEEEEKKFGLQKKLKLALVRARLYGGGALVIGTNVGQPDQELKPDQMKKGGIKFIHAVNRYELSVDRLNTDVLSPFYGEPESYQARSLNGTSVQVHPSRVIRLIGMEVPDPNRSMDGWGDPVMQIVNDAVMNVAAVSGGVAALVNEAKTDIVKIPDFMANLAQQDYRDKIISRFSLANIGKSVVNTLMLDKDEEWERATTSFAALPDILRMYLLIASGAADIPATRLLGQSAVGFNSTGESDIRNYYDRIKSDQESELTPVLDRLDELLIRSALGDRPDEIYYKWNSLWQMTDEEKADVANKKAETHSKDVANALINPDALREGRINQLIEDGFYPGFEATIEEFGSEPEIDENDPAVQAQMLANEAAKQKIDAGGVEPAKIDMHETKLLAGPEKKVADWDAYFRGVAIDYDPDQPRVPAGRSGGGRWEAQIGSGLQSHAVASGMNVKLHKFDRLESGRSYNAKWKDQSFNKEGNPMAIEVARQLKVMGKWRKNLDQAGDYAAGMGWLLAQEFQGMSKFAAQFWHDAAENMTAKEYAYAKSYFATEQGAFAEGYRAAYSPNGKAFGLNRQRTEEVFGRSTGQLRSGVSSTLNRSNSPGLFTRMGNKLANLVGA